MAHPPLIQISLVLPIVQVVENEEADGLAAFNAPEGLMVH
jgi:hypothetical protein